MLPIRSNHLLAAVEQRLNQRTRLRLELYNRADRDLPFQAFAEPRLILNSAQVSRVFAPPVSPLWYNALRGYSRGAEIFLQTFQCQPLQRLGFVRIWQDQAA